jgi:preprotein translocase subunit SecD
MRSYMALFALLLAGCAQTTQSPDAHRAQTDRGAAIAFHLASPQEQPGWMQLTDDAGTPLFISLAPFLTDADVRSAAAFHGRSGSFVQLQLSGIGGQRLQEITRDNVGKRIAILVDGQLVASPLIRDEIAGGKATISANFSRDEAEKLAARLTPGASAQH